MTVRPGQALIVLMLVAGCSHHVAETACNVAVTAPSLRIDVSAYRSAHPGAVARICRTALYPEPVRPCPTYRLDSVPGRTVSMFAPPYGMVVSVTLTSDGPLVTATLRVEGDGGRCGAYRYPPLRLTVDGRLVTA